MRQHSNSAKDTAEKAVKDIRRATRKQYSSTGAVIVVDRFLKGQHEVRRTLDLIDDCKIEAAHERDRIGSGCFERRLIVESQVCAVDTQPSLSPTACGSPFKGSIRGLPPPSDLIAGVVRCTVVASANALSAGAIENPHPITLASAFSMSVMRSEGG